MTLWSKHRLSQGASSPQVTEGKLSSDPKDSHTSRSANCSKAQQALLMCLSGKTEFLHLLDVTNSSRAYKVPAGVLNVA